jgi:hypothetical protein
VPGGSLFLWVRAFSGVSYCPTRVSKNVPPGVWRRIHLHDHHRPVTKERSKSLERVGQRPALSPFSNVPAVPEPDQCSEAEKNCPNKKNWGSGSSFSFLATLRPLSRASRQRFHQRRYLAPGYLLSTLFHQVRITNPRTGSSAASRGRSEPI